MDKRIDSKIVFKIIGFILCFGFVSCTTTNVKTSVDDIIHVETKALVEDKIKSESNTVSIELFYVQNNRLRLEISAVLGIQLGSLLMTRDQVSYSMHRQKIFVEGPMSARTLKPLFKQAIDPQIIWALVFEQDISRFGFNCKNDNSVIACAGKDVLRNTTVTNETKANNLKKMIIENPEFKFVWVYKSIKKHNMSYNETFVLKKPEEYRLITIK